MSRHIVESDGDRWIFGWDQPLQSFYLQKHDLNLPEDDQIVTWLGATSETRMYEVEDLVREAQKAGLWIMPDMARLLYQEKDEGIYIGKVIRGWIEDGSLYAEMEIDDAYKDAFGGPL